MILIGSTATKKDRRGFLITQHSRRRLNELPIKVRDHSITLLCRFHPETDTQRWRKEKKQETKRSINTAYRQENVCHWPGLDAYMAESEHSQRSRWCYIHMYTLTWRSLHLGSCHVRLWGCEWRWPVRRAWGGSPAPARPWTPAGWTGTGWLGPVPVAVTQTIE